MALGLITFMLFLPCSVWNKNKILTFGVCGLNPWITPLKKASLVVVSRLAALEG